jgi:transcriptional regulator with XRE-family HTH domain
MLRFHPVHRQLLSGGRTVFRAETVGGRPYFDAMPEHETTVRSRELGEELRRVLEKAELTGLEVARQLGWSQSDVSRMLTGKRAVKETDVATLLGICRVKDRERARLLKLCQEANKRGWWQQYGSRLPKQLRTLIDHEDSAIRISDYQCTLFSGLLQTGDYARAVAERSANLPHEEIDERVVAKLARSRVFGRSPSSRYTFFVHESVLRLPVGGPSVMSDQLHHLLRMSVRPYLELRMLPTAFGAHAATTGSFTLMEFAAVRPIVYLEAETSALFLEESEEIGAYQRILATLANIALDEEQSRELIRTLTVELYGDPEGQDEHA